MTQTMSIPQIDSANQLHVSLLHANESMDTDSQPTPKSLYIYLTV